MAYGKGRATGYSDYYKGSSRTPSTRTNDDEDEMSETIVPRRGISKGKTVDKAAEARRKEALKRRLAKLRASK